MKLELKFRDCKQIDFLNERQTKLMRDKEKMQVLMQSRLDFF
ncbi:hypothetical protein ES703_66695 [subsurface metagenome]